MEAVKDVCKEVSDEKIRDNFSNNGSKKSYDKLLSLDEVERRLMESAKKIAFKI